MRVKLVRDCMTIGQGGIARPANSLAGKHLALLLKLHEEAEEIGRAAHDPTEYADLLETLFELMRINGVRWAQVEKALLAKRKELGGFRRGRIWVKDEP